MIERVVEGYPVFISLIPIIFLLALSKKQRDSILERDDYTSQLRHYSEEKGWHTIDPYLPEGKAKPHVHHIVPQRNGGEDEPDNLITVWEHEHTGRLPDGSFVDGNKKFVIHPDMEPTFARYRKGDKDAFKDMGDDRNAILSLGDTYHNVDHDREMLNTARERTNDSVKWGWKFPYKGRK